MPPSSILSCSSKFYVSRSLNERCDCKTIQDVQCFKGGKEG